MKYLLTLMAAAMLFVACKDDNADDPYAANAERNIIIYMNGENNLSGHVSQSLSQIRSAKANIPYGCNVLVYVDDVSTVNNPYIFQVNSDTAIVVRQFSEDYNSSDPQRMAEIVGWIQARYPADSYGLVLWGHGSGWNIETDTIPRKAARRAYGYDRGNNSSTGSGAWMNYDAMARALETLYPFEFILFDCCNGQNIETAYELRNVTNWLVGSPAEVPANGCPYAKAMTWLFSKDGYRKLAECYAGNYVDGNDTLPMSVISTAKIEALANATYQALPSFMADGGDSIQLDGLPYYFQDSLKTNLQYDMRGIMHRCCDDATYQTWLKAFDQCVVYRIGTGRWMTSYNIKFKSFKDFKNNYGGVSMFLPSSAYAGGEGKYDYNRMLKRYKWYAAAGWSRFGW